MTHCLNLGTLYSQVKLVKFHSTVQASKDRTNNAYQQQKQMSVSFYWSYRWVNIPHCHCLQMEKMNKQVLSSRNDTFSWFEKKAYICSIYVDQVNVVKKSQWNKWHFPTTKRYFKISDRCLLNLNLPFYIHCVFKIGSQKDLTKTRATMKHMGPTCLFSNHKLYLINVFSVH